MKSKSLLSIDENIIEEKRNVILYLQESIGLKNNDLESSFDEECTDVLKLQILIKKANLNKICFKKLI